MSDVERRFAEERIAALVFQDGDCALDRADAGLGYVAVVQGIFLRVLADMDEHRLKVMQVAQFIPFVPRNAEKDVHDAALRLVEAQHTAQQQGTHLFHSGTDRMSLFGINIPEYGGVLFVIEGIGIHAAALQPPVQAFAADPGFHHAAQVAFDIAQENRHAHVGKAFRQDLQGNGFPCAGGPGDQPVPVGHGRQQIDRTIVARADPDLVILQHLQPFFPL